MKLTLAIFGLLALFTPHSSSAQATPPSRNPAAITRKLFIEPSSTSLAGGKARLIVGTLNRQQVSYVGDYQLKVWPYFFKSEKGALSMIVSDESLRKLTQAVPVAFTGKAMTDGSDKTRPIDARATPSATDRGALTFSIQTENGKLVFNTSYRFGDK
jgi:hypothetical protein